MTRYALKMMSSFLIAVLFSGCAGPQALEKSKSAPVPLETLMAEANAAYSSGQIDMALSLLKGAADAYPADKAPWARLAQLKFDSASYGDSIVNALEVLRRDPKDTVAQSLVAVSGLRLSTKALSDLRSQNELSGTVRSEADDLATVLRESIGESVLVPSPGRLAPTKSPSRPVIRPIKRTGGNQNRPVDLEPDAAKSANPFGALR